MDMLFINMSSGVAQAYIHQLIRDIQALKRSDTTIGFPDKLQPNYIFILGLLPSGLQLSRTNRRLFGKPCTRDASDSSFDLTRAHHWSISFIVSRVWTRDFNLEGMFDHIATIYRSY